MSGKTQKKMGFEAAMQALEQIVVEMESGKLSLEEMLQAYQRGAELLALCRGRLDDAVQQVAILEAGVLQEFSAEGGQG